MKLSILGARVIDPASGLDQVTDLHLEAGKIIAIGLLCFAASLFLSALIARSISVPLQRLVGAMKEAGSGDTTVRVEQAGGDEIAMTFAHWLERYIERGILQFNTLSDLMKVQPFDRYGSPSEIATRHFGGVRGMKDAVSQLQTALYQ